MTDVTIKNVPEGAESDVKRMAMVAIERFIRRRDVRVPKAVEEKFEADVDGIREANSLDKKFAKDELEPKEVVK